MSCVLLQDWPASGVDSGCGIHGGVHWLQAGLRSPGYPPRSPPAKYLYYCVISGFQGGFHEGWTPKKIALTLAICRAAPPRIRLETERNRSISMAYMSHKIDQRQFYPTIGYHLRPYKPVQTDLALLATRRSSYRSDSLSIGICHGLQCLTKKCLMRTTGVDAVKPRFSDRLQSSVLLTMRQTLLQQ